MLEGFYEEKISTKKPAQVGCAGGDVGATRRRASTLSLSLSLSLLIQSTRVSCGGLCFVSRRVFTQSGASLFRFATDISREDLLHLTMKLSKRLKVSDSKSARLSAALESEALPRLCVWPKRFSSGQEVFLVSSSPSQPRGSRRRCWRGSSRATRFRPRSLTLISAAL